jgi:hypothetical protein
MVDNKQMSGNIRQEGHRDVGTNTESDPNTDASGMSQTPSSTRSAAEAHGPDRRVNVRDKYDVIIRPSSPPFVSVVATGQVIPQAPLSRPTAASQVSQAGKHGHIQPPPNEFGGESEVLLKNLEAPSKELPGGMRVDRIYSSVARALTKEKRAETPADTIARAIELLPISEKKSQQSGHGSLSIKTTSQAQAIIRSTRALQGIGGDDTILGLNQQRLDRLWDGGKGHVAFVQFVGALKNCVSTAVHWADSGNRVRTLRPLMRRPFARTIRDTDAGSSSSELRRGLIRFAQTDRGYVKVDAASALAISRLMDDDSHNFARVIAACPSIVNVLLDSKKIGHGAIFTDKTVWLTIAYAMPRLQAYGGQITQEIQSLTSAFENYLAFHNPNNLQGPYVEPIKWAYQDSGQKADALANSFADFNQCIERFWTRMCPEDNPIRDVLDRALIVDKLDASIAAIALNIIFSGIDSHLTQVIERRKAYNKAIQRMVKISGALPLDAAKGSAGGLDGGIAGGAIGAICELLLTEAGQAIGSINAQSNFSEMQTLFRTLYTAVRKNAEAGRFVPGQRLLSAAQLGALLPDAARGPIYQDDMKSPEGNRSSIRKGFQEQYTGIDAIASDQEFERIFNKRIDNGKQLFSLMEDIENHNPLSQF